MSFGLVGPLVLLAPVLSSGLVGPGGSPRIGWRYGRPMSVAPRTPSPSVATLGELRASGWQSVPVKDEIRRHAVA